MERIRLLSCPDSGTLLRLFPTGEGVSQEKNSAYQGTEYRAGNHIAQVMAVQEYPRIGNDDGGQVVEGFPFPVKMPQHHGRGKGECGMSGGKRIV